MTQSKTKGSSFEREIAKLLSLWFSKGKRDDCFYRTQSSGGRFTSRKKKELDTYLQSGDITSTDSFGEPLSKSWSMEIKSGYGRKQNEKIILFDTLDFLDSRQKEPVLQKMWAQCTRDAELTNRTPVLIFRRNNRTPCIMFSLDYYKTLEGFFGSFNNISITIQNCIIMPLKNFFEWIPNISPALKG